MGKKSKRKKLQKEQISAKPKTISPIRPPGLDAFEKHPYLISICVIALLMIIFFFPVLFQNKIMMPPDSLNNMAHVPYEESSLKEGEYPLWNPYYMNGMPSLASLTRAPYADPLAVLAHIPVSIALKYIVPGWEFIRILANYIFFGIAIFIMLRALKINVPIALLGVISVLLMPEVIAWSAFGHNTKLGTMVFAPLIFIFTERLFAKRNILYLSLLGIAIGQQLLRAHTQMSYYTFMMVGIYAIYWTYNAVRDKKKWTQIAGSYGMLAGAFTLGLLLSSFLSLPVLEYTHYSIRGEAAGGGLPWESATSWSLPFLDTLNFLIPSFTGFGGSTYWGPMIFTDFPVYFGLIPLFLAGFAFILNRNRMVWFFTIFGSFALIIAFGRYIPVLYRLMYDYLPFFNKFRAPKMITIFTGISLVVMSSYGLQGLFRVSGGVSDKIRKQIVRYIQIFGAVLIVLFLVLLFGQSLYLNWASKIVTQQGDFRMLAHERAVSGGLKALILFGISAGMVMTIIKNKKWVLLAPFVFIVLVLIDCWPQNKKFVEYYPISRKEAFFRATSDVNYLKDQADVFRILPIWDRPRDANWYIYHGLQTVTGFHAARLKLYDTFINFFLAPGTGNLPYKYVKINDDGSMGLALADEITAEDARVHSAFMKMMNVKYIVSSFNFAMLDTTLQTVVQRSNQAPFYVFEYKEYLPRVHFPDNIQLMEDENTLLSYMISGEFNPDQTAIIEKEPPFAIQPYHENDAVITEYGNHTIEIQAQVEKPGILVLSDMYYPAGWKAYVNGTETEIYKTNYSFRSVFLEPGSHNIVFQFEPKSFKTGLFISITAFILLVAGAVAGYKIYKKKYSASPLSFEQAGDFI